MLRYFCFSLSIIFLPFQAVSQSLKPFSGMDIFELEWASDPRISPDGNLVVYQRQGMDKMKDRRTSSLWLINTDGSKHRKLTTLEKNESGARWSPDGRKIAFISSDEGHGSELYVYWLESGIHSRITQLNESPGGITWSPDGTRIAFSMKETEPNPTLVPPPKKPEGAEWADHPRVTKRLNYLSDGSGYVKPGFSHIFVVPAEGGTSLKVTSGDYHHDSAPEWRDDGKSLVFSANRHEDWEYERRNSEIYSVNISDGAITVLTDRFGPDFSPKVSPAGDKIAYLGYDDKIQTYQVNRLYIMNSDGSAKREIETGLDRSITSIEWDENGNGIYLQYDDRGDTKIAHTNLTGRVSAVAQNVGGTSVGRPYSGGSFTVSADGRIAMNRTTPYHPAELAVTTRKDDDPVMLTNLNDDLLSNRELGEVEEIWYNSQVDGREIQGWIVKPPAFNEDRQYPLLVEIHGGPVTNYGARFSPEMQLYAADGYVVFYPNPRGSTGYGEEFGNLLYHDYPGDDYHDIMDGVDVLLEKGYLHGDSLFVTGGSAGGTMTSWIIGKNNRFRAAAVIKPVMNWISKTLTADNYYGYAEYRYPGQPWENFEEYWKYSPISLVGNIETPTLVMVGTEDLRTPLSEASQLYHALKLRKVESALVEIPGSAHFIANRPSQMMTKVDHILAWFREYRGGD